MSQQHPVVALELQVLSEQSPRVVLEAALGRVNAQARRTPRLDRIGRESEAWRDLHGFLDSLLNLWERAGG